MVAFFTSTLAEEPLLLSEELLAVAIVFPSTLPAVVALPSACWLTLVVLLTAIVVFPSICRPAAAPLAFARLAALTELAADARRALLTEGVFKEAAELRWVALAAPSLIWAEDDWLIINAAEAIKLIAMILLNFIIPVLIVRKLSPANPGRTCSVCLYIIPSPHLLPPEIKKGSPS